MTKWMPPTIAGVVLAGTAAAILAFQPLGEADKYASVGSFLVAILAFAFAVHAHRSATEKPAGSRGGGTSAFINNGKVQIGSRSRFVDRNPASPRQPAPHTNQRADHLFVGNDVVQKGDDNEMILGPVDPDPRHEA